MKRAKLFLFIIIISLLSSCTGISQKRSGIKFGKQNSQVASKTLNYSIEWVDEATLKVLDEMEIFVIENDITSDGKSIKAATFDLDILIEFKPVTESLTHMKIDIKSSGNPGDNPTATEIINQTQTYLSAGQTLGKADISEGIDFNLDNFPTN